MKIKLTRAEWTKLLSRGRLVGGFSLVSHTKCEAVVHDEKLNTYIVVCR